MPRLNGIGSTKKIRNFLPNEMKLDREDQPKIVGLTGHVTDDYIKAGLDSGMDAIYGKPLYFNVLEQIIEKYY